MKKTLLLLISIIFFVLSGYSQYWLTLMPVTKKAGPKFEDYSNAFYDYWDEHDHENHQAYKHFKRLEWYMAPRLNDRGDFPSRLYLEEIEKLENHRAVSDASWGDWTNLGPDYTPYWWQQNRLSGSGRLDCVAFHPTDTSTIWIGAHSGGFWKSTDAGQTWYTTTDHLPSIGVSTIAVHPDDPDILYIGTGDRDTWVAYGIGILKSVDGGETWESTGFINELPENNIINKILINPLQPEIMYVATYLGIYKSTDAAESWERLFLGNFKDITFIEDHYDELLATNFNPYGNAKIFKSADAGDSWASVGTDVISSTQVCRIALATTPANPDVIYAVASRKYPNANLYGVYRSDDAGDTWIETVSGDDINLLGRSAYGADTEGYGWYTLTIEVSEFDEDVIYTGGINLWKSDDGGYNWSILTHETPGTLETYNTWVDYHALQCRPGTAQLFCCHDGGIIKTYDLGENFSNISDGLSILQCYKIGLSPTNEEKALCGPQDQFTMYRQNETDWNCIYFGESGENFFDITDEQTFYVSGYGGGFRRTTNGGGSFYNITPQGESFYNWLAPFLSHPTDPNTIFVGINDVYRSHSQGSSWEKISEGLSPSVQLTILEVAKSNPEVMVAGTGGVLWRTRGEVDGWELISGGLPNQQVTGVCFSAENADNIWVSLGGFTDGQKVYKSEDCGETWQNFSMNLPNVPATCIVYEDGSDDAIYVGTDLGVFYLCNSISQWLDFGKGLPNVVLGELEIHYGSGKIRAGSYGRGLWESPLMDPTILGVDELQEVAMFVWPNPAKDYLKFRLKTDHTSVMVSIQNIIGETLIADRWTGYSSMEEKTINISALPKGVYLVNVETENEIISQKVIVE